MISPEELAGYITTLRAAGITGKAKIGDIEITIPPIVEMRGDGKSDRPKSQKAAYDDLLFAASEGIREDDGEGAS